MPVFVILMLRREDGVCGLERHINAVGTYDIIVYKAFGVFQSLGLCVNYVRCATLPLLAYYTDPSLKSDNYFIQSSPLISQSEIDS